MPMLTKTTIEGMFEKLSFNIPANYILVSTAGHRTWILENIA